jgi:hypothetical protein
MQKCYQTILIIIVVIIIIIIIAVIVGLLLSLTFCNLVLLSCRQLSTFALMFADPFVTLDFVNLVICN